MIKNQFSEPEDGFFGWNDGPPVRATRPTASELFDSADDDEEELEFANPRTRRLPADVVRREMRRQHGLVILEADYDSQSFDN